MDLAVVALTFGAIFVVELPDKTFIAALVLSTRYRPLLVWLGVGLAFFVQVLSRSPPGSSPRCCRRPWSRASPLAIFLAGAFVLFRTAPGADAEEQEAEEEYAAKATEERTGLKAVVASFLVLFAAEWGDLSQLLTISLVAKYGEPLERLRRRLGRAARGVRARGALGPGAAALHAAVAAALHRRRGLPGPRRDHPVRARLG